MLMGYKEEGIFRRVGEFALKYVSTHKSCTNEKQSEEGNINCNYVKNII